EGKREKEDDQVEDDSGEVLRHGWTKADGDNVRSSSGNRPSGEGQPTEGKTA
ncbi:hypothetical protein NL676_021496, partial [Syzygium grande]